MTLEVGVGMSEVGKKRIAYQKKKKKRFKKKIVELY